MAGRQVCGNNIHRVKLWVSNLEDVLEVELKLDIQLLGKVVQGVSLFSQVNFQILEQGLNNIIVKEYLKILTNVSDTHLDTWIHEMQRALMISIETGEQGCQWCHQGLEPLHLFDVPRGEEDLPSCHSTVLVQGIAFCEPGLEKTVDHFKITPPINT